jgi:anti-anti-sigma regulatory factor
MQMPAAFNSEILTAPERIISDTRAEFRRTALEFIEKVHAERGTAAAIDLSLTTEVDASGLGILVLMQKRAKELGVTLVLSRTPVQVRYLLTLTKLDHLFEFAD